jgi:hypothetical protein
MSKRLGIVALVLLVLASCAVVSASEQTSMNRGTIIQPANNADFSIMSPLIVTGSITQGQTTWQTKSVSSYITSMNVNMNWVNPANSLQLKIYAPDGEIFGPVYDNYDGKIDGRINLNVINSAGLPKGVWNFEIYGYRVSGSETYTI